VSLRTKRGAAAAVTGLTVAGSILLGVVGNLAANTVGDIGSGWKPVIWIALGALAAVAIVSAVVKTLRAGDSAAESRRDDETDGGQRPGKRKRPWQLKAMFAVWGLLAALALVGTVHAIARPASADIERIYLWAFDAQRNDVGGWEVTPAVMIAVFLAVFGWLTPPFFAATNVYDAVPRSAGPTVRALATFGGFGLRRLGWLLRFACGLLDPRHRDAAVHRGQLVPARCFRLGSHRDGLAAEGGLR
jgi:hypothetical protein